MNDILQELFIDDNPDLKDAYFMYRFINNKLYISIGHFIFKVEFLQNISSDTYEIFIIHIIGQNEVIDDECINIKTLLNDKQKFLREDLTWNKELTMQDKTMICSCLNNLIDVYSFMNKK